MGPIEHIEFIVGFGADFVELVSTCTLPGPVITIYIFFCATYTKRSLCCVSQLGESTKKRQDAWRFLPQTVFSAAAVAATTIHHIYEFTLPRDQRSLCCMTSLMAAHLLPST
mmetsp:Transcript_22914/g.58768  ORF Transcript_22914/g.58768 Transcript_22914/m.58768 type:complete len:112 (+) Transcript_22914:60-395(+)